MTPADVRCCDDDLVLELMGTTHRLVALAKLHTDNREVHRALETAATAAAVAMCARKHQLETLAKSAAVPA